MEQGKEVIFKVKVEPERAHEFQRICKAEERNVSAVLRELMGYYVSTHKITEKKLGVEVTVGGPYGRGARDKDEFKVEAVLTGDWKSKNINELNFLLPDFKVNGVEPYRVDSFHTHRAIFPKCRNEDGRLLGAKFVEGKWKGAIFLYDAECFKNQEACFEEIKSKIEEAVMTSINQLALEADKGDEENSKD